jgi:hypothetical protein
VSGLTLTDGKGATADFDRNGFLLSWRSGDVEWRPAAPLPGWSVTLDVGGAETEAAPAGPGQVMSLGLEALEIVFDGLRAGGAAVPARVAVVWRLQDGLLQGTISLTGLPDSHILRALVFPDLTIAFGEPRDTSLVVPADAGWLIQEAALALAEGGESAEGLRLAHAGMQFHAWIEAGRGLYLDTRDTAGWMREWRFQSAGEKRVRFRCAHLAPRRLDPPGAFSLPYPVSLGGFTGGWYEAARMYRPWALQAPWARRGPQERRSNFVADIACWVWNRGRAADVAPPALELARRIGAPIALDWYWWHKHGYDTEYPDYFPPREGEATFKAAVRDLQSHDVRVQVYTNGMCHDVDGKAWEPDGPECALMREDGSWFAPAYNTFTNHHLASVCGGSARWRPILLGLVRQAKALGLDGLYLDMIGAVGGRMPCFHPRHAHAPGGGCYGVQGFRETLRQARELAPGFPLSTESSLEWYLDLFDSHIICGVSLERLKWQAESLGGRTRVIPLFSAVYHGRAVGFGNYSFIDGVPPYDELWPPGGRSDPARERDWVALCPDQFALELARTVTFGFQPLVANLRSAHFSEPRMAGDIAFLVELCRLYHREREFLLWGEMLPPGKLECRSHETVFLQRFVFTLPGEETYLRRAFPAVFHSAWQAPDGRRAAILVNYTREPAAVSYQPAGGLQVDAAGSVRPAGARFRPAGDGVEFELPARSAVRLALRDGVS